MSATELEFCRHFVEAVFRVRYDTKIVSEDKICTALQCIQVMRENRHMYVDREYQRKQLCQAYEFRFDKAVTA